jgi:hypothetical protein
LPGGKSEIYAMKVADGSNQRQLTNNSAVDLVPNCWQFER